MTNYRTDADRTPAQDAILPDNLNKFYARFDRDNRDIPSKAPCDPEETALQVTHTQVLRALRKVNPRKAVGPDRVAPRVLKACAEQLAEVYTDIFLSQETVPRTFKSSVIVPVPKKTNATTMNDLRPVALTAAAMKCLEKLVLTHINSVVPHTVDPYQFAYRPNRSVDDAVALALHSILQHLDSNNTYALLLFLDYSSAFNTIRPLKLTAKLADLGVPTPSRNWILDFLTDRPQVVRMGKKVSAELTVSTGTPQGCCLSPELFSLYTYDCAPPHNNNSIIIKYADDTTIIGLIRGGDESAYRDLVSKIAVYGEDNDLVLNLDKTRELIVDYRRKAPPLQSLTINRTEAERTDSHKFLGLYITESLSWAKNTAATVKRAQQRLHFIRLLKKAGLKHQPLTQAYRGLVESILTSGITVWYGNTTVAERKRLQRVIKTAERVIGSDLPSMDTIFTQRSRRKAQSILRDKHHPAHALFQWVDSGYNLRHRRPVSIRTHRARFHNSFFPATVRLVAQNIKGH